jgi:molecular chaperone DnaJ
MIYPFSQEHCTSCGGSGVVEGIKDVKVTIPEGLF